MSHRDCQGWSGNHGNPRPAADLGPEPVVRGDKKGQEGDAEGHSGPGQPSSQGAACQGPGPFMMRKPGTSGQPLSLKETQLGLLWTEGRVNLPICPLGLLFIHWFHLANPCRALGALGCGTERRIPVSPHHHGPVVKQTQVRNSVRVRTQPTSRRGTLLGERGQPESFLEEVKT